MEMQEVGVPVSARVRANHTVAWEQTHLAEAENLEPGGPVAEVIGAHGVRV
uniref:Uncharacterized protein n=1 Tax=viral metagenome TaxID=1070528 RepID=A0A6M3XLV4_9ZZZZ